MRQQRGAIVCIRLGHAPSTISTSASASAATDTFATSAIIFMPPAIGETILPLGGARPVRAKQRVQVPLRGRKDR